MEKQYESHDTNTNTNLPIIYIFNCNEFKIFQYMCKYLFVNSFNFFLENYFIYELFIKYSTFLSMEHLLMSDRLFAT